MYSGIVFEKVGWVDFFVCWYRFKCRFGFTVRNCRVFLTSTGPQTQYNNDKR